MTRFDVYGIGNALVDTEYKVDDTFLKRVKLSKGLMTLIEEDEKKELTRLLEQGHRRFPVKQSGGGSAANTMTILSQLGSKTFYSCKVADDERGKFFLQDLKNTGISTNDRRELETGITGHCISMITPDAERTMTTCLGITNFFSTKELDYTALESSTYLYIEGYLVSSKTGFQAAVRAQEIAKNSGAIVSLTLSDPSMVENYRAEFFQLFDNGVDLLFCNLNEAQLLTGTTSIEDCTREIKKLCGKFAVTCGKDGSIAFNGDTLATSAGFKTTALDTTGAGDIFAGVFLHCLTKFNDFEYANQLANKFASKLVSRFGARLTSIEVEEVLNL